MKNTQRKPLCHSSTSLPIRGAMIQESYAVLASWDPALSMQENHAILRENNPFGSVSDSWAEKVVEETGSRFNPQDYPHDFALALLARQGFPLDKWKPILLWRLCHFNGLLADFLQNWLFKAFDEGILRIRPADLFDYLGGVSQRGKTDERSWTQSTIEHVAQGLLKIPADFGLMQGKLRKEFLPYHLPEESFFFILHAIHERVQNAGRIIESPDWRIFLMRPDDVERELVRLHQFRKLEYHSAGTFKQLSLPYETALEYAERIAQ